MFFSTELLSKRDSGFGLLWLAATLGSKSSFRKLPKRSVLTADIAQLCDLISEPAEPLALRLSSNLMVGVVRVYKVKQELFLSDVTTCFHSLKKAVADFQSMAATAAQLQMGQPSVRPNTITLSADPGAEFAMNFDHLFANWDEYLETRGKINAAGEDPDDEYSASAKKSKGRDKQKSMSIAEDARADLHTLQEDYDHLLSVSFDASFAADGVGPSSSQFDGGFGFGLDDNFLGGADGLEIGDELARELGEGWGGPLEQNGNDDAYMDQHVDLGLDDANMGMDMDLGGEFAFGGEPLAPAIDATDINQQAASANEVRNPESNKENVAPSPLPLSPNAQRLASSPTPMEEQDANQPEIDGQPGEIADLLDKPQKKAKRVRLLLDPRTELTDEELQAARTNYIEGQYFLRNELEMKRFQKEGAKIIEEMIWGVPQGLHAQVLVDFWLNNFKIQVQARSGLIHLDEGEPPRKRRKSGEHPLGEDNAVQGDQEPAIDNWEEDPEMRLGQDMDMDMNMNMDLDMGGDLGDMQGYNDVGHPGSTHIRSSEEPDVGRRASRPPSVLSYLGRGALGTPLAGSQRSSLFPWDNAGASSSAGGAPFGSASQVSVGHADIRLRSSQNGSKRASSMIPSRMGSLGGIGAASTADFGRLDSQMGGDDFQFDMPADNTAPVEESQMSETNLLTLERNSFNFLEYAKMQNQTLSDANQSLTFDDVVPKATSTPHVAAAAFYHCLVLATKDLLRLDQQEPYGPVKLIIN